MNIYLDKYNQVNQQVDLVLHQLLVIYVYIKRKIVQENFNPYNKSY